MSAATPSTISPATLASPAGGSDAPIGIFDSGLGGLSVLRHVRAQLPHERLLYFADSGFAPYGGRSEQEIVGRALAVAQFLSERQVKALVVACNTATACAIAALRAAYPALPVVGVEPGLKPAMAATASGVVGVLATASTVASARFAALQAELSAQGRVRFISQACPGLADQVEKGELHTHATAVLLNNYVAPLLAAGADTLVLGCTHYPFLEPLLVQLCARWGYPDIRIIDTGEPVARQLRRLLETRGQLAASGAGAIEAYTSGTATSLQHGFARLLGLDKLQVTALG